ncbi:thioredoxin [Pirellulales bacterium]|nr:thioredoxin [Pirellulales bacterium]
MKTSQVVKLSDANFQDEVLTSDQPVLVDYWAPWCAPCRAVGPTIDELAETNAGRVKFGKVNVDENTETPQTYGVSSIPTVLVFKSGKVVETLVGVQSRERYQQAIEDIAA